MERRDFILKSGLLTAAGALTPMFLQGNTIENPEKFHPI